MSNSVLVSPLHDPEGRLYTLIDEVGNQLLEVFDHHVFVSITPKTHPSIIAELHAKGFKIHMLSEAAPDPLGDNYLQAIQMGVESRAEHMMLVDFDRAIHWVKTFPDELKQVVRDLSETQGLVIFVRSERAFQTHPNVQQKTEEIINDMASFIAGQTVDIMSGAFGFDRELAQHILKIDHEHGYAIYAEFLKVALRDNFPVSSITVEGLEWETPDQFQKEIAELGYDSWLDQFESHVEWGKRMNLIEKSLEVITKTT